MIFGEMRYNFSVGSRFESVPFMFELLPKFHEVFDYSIVDNGHTIHTVSMRMSILCRWRPVCSPSCVTDSHSCWEATYRKLTLNLVDLPFIFLHNNPAVDDGSLSHGVVTPVFEPFQAFIEDRPDFTILECYACNSTHLICNLSDSSQPFLD